MRLIVLTLALGIAALAFLTLARDWRDGEPAALEEIDEASRRQLDRVLLEAESERPR
jgi:hypothetical protein